MSKVPPDPEQVEQSTIQVDFSGIKVRARLGAKVEETPPSWKAVAKRINKHLRGIVAGTFGLAEDMITGAQRFVRGVSRTPDACADRIQRSHAKTEENERNREIDFSFLRSATPEQLAPRLEELLLTLKARGSAVRVFEPKKGHWLIAVVRPDQEAGGEIAAVVKDIYLESRSSEEGIVGSK